MDNIGKTQTHGKKIVEYLLDVGIIKIVSALVMGVVFSGLAEDIWFKEPLAWDKNIMLSIHHLASPFLDAVMRVVTQLGEIGTAAAVVVLFLYFEKKQQRANMACILIVYGGAVVLNALAKAIFRRPRPDLFPPLVNEHSFSFPSGHVAASAAVFGFIAVLLWQNQRYIWAALSSLIIPIVAFSRVYLGVHYPSDVLGAFAFSSIFILVVLMVSDQKAKTSRDNRQKQEATSLATAACGGAEKKAFVTGAAVYREKIALPPNAVATVQVRDITIMDAAAPLIAEQVIELQGKQAPVDFRVEVDPADIDPSRIYAVSARITVEDKLLFTTDRITRVITGGNPPEGLNLLLVAIK